MKEEQKRLLIEFANALDSASALARRMAECEPQTVELTVDAETFAKAVYRANRDSHGASES